MDTGAYRTGVLTALGLEANERWFLQTGAAEESTDLGDRVAKYQHA